MTNLTTYEYDIFLSHNHADQEWTTKLAERIEQEDWKGRKLKVFFSPWDIRPGQSIPKEIEKALPKSRKVGLIMSPEAIDSAWVELERLVTTYIAVTTRDERLIPLYRRTTNIPALLQPLLFIDFRDDHNFEPKYQTLLSVIKEEPLARSSVKTSGSSMAIASLIPRPPVVGFVARRDNEGRDLVERLKEELAQDKNQLVALWGAGGVGKTTIAAEAVRLLAKTPNQRVVWTSADGRANFAFSTLLDDIAEQLERSDLRPLAVGPKEEALRPIIAENPTLIVLDNLETIPPEEELLCKNFLAYNAGCPALITTRERIDNAHLITIAAMSSAEAAEFLDKLIRQTHDSNIYADVERHRILEAAEFNPLIIQWIVGQIDLAQDPNEVLRDLAHGEGDAAQRVFDRSFELPQMGEGGRVTLMALSLFMPSATRPSLAEVAGMATEKNKKRFRKAQQTLASLWLLKQTDGGERLVIAGLTRELAKARLERDQLANALRRRFVLRFAKYAEANSKPNVAELNALAREKDNLLAAMDVALQIRAWDDLTRIFDALKDFLNLRGYWDDAINYGEHTVVAAKIEGNDPRIARLTANTARFRHLRGEYDKAREGYEQSLEFYRGVGDQVNQAISLNQLGALEFGLDDLQAAEKFYLQSLEIAKNLAAHKHTLGALNNLGLIEYRRGNFTKARKLFDEAFEKKPDLADLGAMLENTAYLVKDQEKLKEARELGTESLELRKKLGDQAGIARAQLLLGRLDIMEGNYAAAESIVTEALVSFKALALKPGISGSLKALGDIHFKRKSFRPAQSYYDEALKEAVAANDRFSIGSIKVALGLLAGKEGDKDRGVILLRESIDIFKDVAPGRLKKTEELLLDLIGTS